MLRDVSVVTTQEFSLRLFELLISAAVSAGSAAREFCHGDVAADGVAGARLNQRRLDFLAYPAELARAARLEHAAWRQVQGAGYVPLEAHPAGDGGGRPRVGRQQ